MSINLLVLSLIKQINELRVNETDNEEEKSDKEVNREDKSGSSSEKNASALIFVILEICVKDLIKYLPDLLNSSSKSESPSIMHKQSSFLYLHVAKCKQINSKDVELIGNLLGVLGQLPFHLNINFESKFLMFNCVRINVSKMYFFILKSVCR